MLFILLELLSLMLQIFIVVASYESNARQITSRGGTKEDLRIKRKEKMARQSRDPASPVSCGRSQSSEPFPPLIIHYS